MKAAAPYRGVGRPTAARRAPGRSFHRLYTVRRMRCGRQWPLAAAANGTVPPAGRHAAADDRHPREGTVHHLFQAARDNATEALTALAAAAHFLGFFAALYGALDKLSH